MVVLTIVLVVLAGEGLYALAHFKSAEPSAIYKIYSMLRPAKAPSLDPDWPEITNVDQIKPYLDAMRDNGVGLGNSPFHGLQTGKASMRREVDGCREMKPNLHETMSYLRSELFNNFNPINYFYDSSNKLPADLAQFLDKYTFRKVTLTTNEHGERLTLPSVQSNDKILVVGDSMGLSAMVNDDETLASQLQAQDPTHQYVNIGVGGADAKDIVCAIERAAKRYAGQIRGIIYPFCENDLSKSKPLGQPEELIPRLARIKEDNKIDSFTIIYMPYIFNAIPDVTRFPGHPDYSIGRHWDEKKRLLQLASKAGFKALDYTEITDAERKATGSQFAAFALFIDRLHLSRYGIQRLVERLHTLNG